jgi:hypothetical protein
VNHLGTAGGAECEQTAAFTGDQGAEDRLTVEVRKAQPHDATAYVDQRRRARITEQAEITERGSVGRNVAVQQPSDVPGHALLVPGTSIDSRDGYKTLAGRVIGAP